MHEELCAHIRSIVTETLGDRAASVHVLPRDSGAIFSIAVVTPQGWRHGVSVACPVNNPVETTARVCAAILAWLDAKSAHVALSAS